MFKIKSQLRRPWVWTAMLLVLVASMVSATGVVSYNRGWGNHRTVMLAELPQHDANLVERTRRAEWGLLEIDRLPAGVDRALAAKAEAEGNAFAYEDSDAGVPGCSIVLRLPTGGVVDVFPGTDAVGGAVEFKQRDTGCSGHRVPASERPAVSDRPARWEAAIRAAEAYTYAVPVTGPGHPSGATVFGIPQIRVDTNRCTGYMVPVQTPRTGIAIPPTAPQMPSSLDYCFGTVPGSY